MSLYDTPQQAVEQEIIPAVPRELLRAELTPARMLRRSNKGDNEIYIVDAHCAPHTMREIGRLREIAFRDAGGGTGLECDIDEFDIMPNPCRQLLVWNPAAEEIIGGYRFILGADVQITAEGAPHIATGHLFHFSDKFLKNYLPHTLELGRSFVTLEYQSSRKGAKALFALDNLWDGLGALTVLHPEIKYLFGKVTMYPSYGTRARDMLLAFIMKHFPDPDQLIRPLDPLKCGAEDPEITSLFTGADFKEDYRILNQSVRAMGENIPPLVNAYIGLSRTMRYLGTAINDEFGDVEESGILVTVKDILEDKQKRHMGSFIQSQLSI